MDLAHVCRTCLRIPKNPIDLRNNNEIMKKLSSVRLIKVENIKGMPNQICEECLKNVNHFFKFLKLLRHTDHDLRLRLETLEETNYTCKPRSIKPIKNEFKIKIEDETLVMNTTDDEITDPEEQRERSPLKICVRCDKCNKVFDDRRKLYLHKNGHTRTVLKAVCSICGVKVQSDNLQRHMRIHTEQPYQCNVCKKYLKNSNSMACHMLRHSDKIIVCEICGKSYNVQQNLRRHMRTHLDPDSLKKNCVVCGAVILSSSMSRHMRTHTGEKPYQCSSCEKAFISSYALKSHVQSHHKSD